MRGLLFHAALLLELLLLVLLLLMANNFVLLLLLGLGHRSLLVHPGVHTTDLRRMAHRDNLLASQSIGVNKLALVGVWREKVTGNRSDVVTL